MTVIPSSLHSSNFPTQRQAALAVVTGTTRLKRLTLKNLLSYWAATVGDNFTNHVPDGEGLGGGVQSVPKHLWLSSVSLTKVDFFSLSCSQSGHECLLFCLEFYQKLEGYRSFLASNHPSFNDTRAQQNEEMTKTTCVTTAHVPPSNACKSAKVLDDGDI